MVTRMARTDLAVMLVVAVGVGVTGCNRAYSIRGPYALGFDGTDHSLQAIGAENDARRQPARKP